LGDEKEHNGPGGPRSFLKSRLDTKKNQVPQGPPEGEESEDHTTRVLWKCARKGSIQNGSCDTSREKERATGGLRNRIEGKKKKPQRTAALSSGRGTETRRRHPSLSIGQGLKKVRKPVIHLTTGKRGKRLKITIT